MRYVLHSAVRQTWNSSQSPGMPSPKGEFTNSKDTTVYVLRDCRIPENETLLDRRHGHTRWLLPGWSSAEALPLTFPDPNNIAQFFPSEHKNNLRLNDGVLADSDIIRLRPEGGVADLFTLKGFCECVCVCLTPRPLTQRHAVRWWIWKDITIDSCLQWRRPYFIILRWDPKQPRQIS